MTGAHSQVKLCPDWTLSRRGSVATRASVTAVSRAQPPRSLRGAWHDFGARQSVGRPPSNQSIFFPSNDVRSSTPSIAVWFWWSRTGFVSTNSAERTFPVSASISMARWASR